MSNKIKWGVLGYARIANDFVIPAIVKASNSKFYAIASRKSESLRECQEKFHCNKTYESYDLLLADPEVQAVYIPLPNSLHREWTIKAARQGKHILCEKPLALNVVECREMIQECSFHQVKLMEAFMYRYTDRIEKVRKVLASGVLGDIKYFNSSFRFLLNLEHDVRMEPELGGGSLYDVGCYPVNFAGMITGSVPVSIAAKAEFQNGVDVLLSSVLQYQNGTIANLNCGFNAYDRVFSEIIGTKGILEIPDTFSGNSGTITLTTETGRQEINVVESDRYLLEVEDFADAVINNRQPLFSLEETIRNMEVIDRLLELIRSQPH